MELNVIAEQSGRPWYAGGLNFTCAGCGNCCTGGPGFVWLSEAEIGRLAAHLRLSAQEVADRYCRRLGDRCSLNEIRNSRGEHDCVFLREEPAAPAQDGQVIHGKRTCAVYPVRPLQCRTWPFWEGNLASLENWRRGARRCPGMDHGRHWTQEEIEALRDAKDWPQRAPSSEPRP